jgi:hypothetical protein
VSGWRREIATPPAAWLLLILLSACSLLPNLCEGASTIPGEGRHSLFYVVTHLHPVVYLILFLISVLSVINLIAQGWVPLRVWPFSEIDTISPKMRGKRARGPRRQSLERAPADSRGKARSGKEGVGPLSRGVGEEGIVGVRRLAKGLDRGPAVNIPTPMDGINHSLPQFAPTAGGQTGAPRILEGQPDQKQSVQEFKFSSAVDVVSQIEMERREREQLVVSGTVTGTDGRGIAAVMVYLTDPAGNRVGQSSRSAQDTGEFKVLVNEPGQYALNGYKRGFVMENSEPLILPVELGKIEGFNFRMMPEGCLVRGRVLIDGETVGVPDLEVKCICGDGTFFRTDHTDPAGEFRIAGVPLSSKCLIEVSGTDGEVLGRSTPFETLYKKEIYRKIAVPSPVTTEKTSASSDSAVEWDADEEDIGDPPHSPAVGS